MAELLVVTPRAGEIGPVRREIIFEPLQEPARPTAGRTRARTGRTASGARARSAMSQISGMCGAGTGAPWCPVRSALPDMAPAAGGTPGGDSLL